MKCELVIEIKCANGMITFMKEDTIPFCPLNGMLLSEDEMGYEVDFCNYDFKTKTLIIYLEEQSAGDDETGVASLYWKQDGWTVVC